MHASNVLIGWACCCCCCCEKSTLYGGDGPTSVVPCKLSQYCISYVPRSGIPRVSSTIASWPLKDLFSCKNTYRPSAALHSLGCTAQPGHLILSTVVGMFAPVDHQCLSRPASIALRKISSLHACLTFHQGKAFEVGTGCGSNLDSQVGVDFSPSIRQTCAG